MAQYQAALDEVFTHMKTVLQEKQLYALPDPWAVLEAKDALVTHLPNDEMPLDQLTQHLLNLSGGLSNSSLASTYYGFVTGGTTAQARIADLLTNLYDQSAAVHLPDQSIATDVEDRALVLLQELLAFSPQRWSYRTLTTGATAGNIQGLALGRESILNRRLSNGNTVGDIGLLAACKQAGIDEIKVMSTNPHASVLKAASIVGLGRNCYVDVRIQDQDEEHLAIDFNRLEQELKVPGRASIVAVSTGEVNTGNFATSSEDEVRRIRDLCDRHGAWLHVDGAFGLFARLLEGSGAEYRTPANGAKGVEYADSIAGDLHKFLNVPYDCGFFMARTEHAHIGPAVYTNGNAGYYPGSLDRPLPQNIRAENSSRFRGFAVYSTLVGLGRQRYIEILKAQVNLARSIAEYIDKHAGYELLNGRTAGDETQRYSGIFMIVLFRANDTTLNAELAAAINARRKMYVSGTKWKGQSACRIAISNWQASHEDLEVVREVLDAVAA